MQEGNDNYQILTIALYLPSVINFILQSLLGEK